MVCALRSAILTAFVALSNLAHDFATACTALRVDALNPLRIVLSLVLVPCSAYSNKYCDIDLVAALAASYSAICFANVAGVLLAKSSGLIVDATAIACLIACASRGTKLSTAIIRDFQAWKSLDACRRALWSAERLPVTITAPSPFASLRHHPCPMIMPLANLMRLPPGVEILATIRRVQFWVQFAVSIAVFSVLIVKPLIRAIYLNN